MESIWDLPAHPLFVHAPIVLAPLVCLAAIALAVQPRWRPTYRWHLVIATAIVAIATQLTISSGEALDDAIDTGELVAKHRDLAESTRLWLLGWLVLTVATAAYDRWARTPTDTVRHSLSGATVVLGVLTTIWMFRTGHEGSSIVWRGVL